MRQANVLKPILAAANYPAISAAVGLGTGGAAGIEDQDDGGSFGLVSLYPGPGYSAAGHVALTFQSTPAALFIAPDEALGPVTQATVGNVVTISWTAASFKPASTTKKYIIAFEWAVSQ